MRYLLCLSLLAAPAFSVACSNASTWHEQAECRNQQIGNEKQALDQAVSAYSATLSPADKELFKKAQSAWKAYADATCKLSAAPVAAGSMYGAYLSSCELNLSEQRRQMLEYQATCEKSSERTDCLEQFKPGSPANPVTATTTRPMSSSPKASEEDVDRLTTYGAALGKGIACKANGVDEASRRVGKWMDVHFPPGSDDQKTYLLALTQGIEASARIQAEMPTESCDSVRKSFSNFPWP